MIKNRKKAAILVPLYVVVVIVIGIAAAHMLSGVNVNDMDGIKECIEQAPFVDGCEVEFECDEPVVSANGKVFAVQCRFKDENEYDGEFFYFEQDKYVKSRYSYVGGGSMTEGRITAHSQVLGSTEYIFICGFGVDERYTGFEIPELGITREIKDGRYLEVIDTADDQARSYDVEMIE